MLDELTFSFGNIVTIASFIVVSSGLYWKITIDIKKLELQIIDMQCDREKKWKKYDEKQDKQDAYLADIMRGINEVKISTNAIKTDIEWLKKK